MTAKEIDLSTALARIKSGSAGDRKEGLADLEHIFRFNRGTQRVEGLKDKIWHSIYEALFECTAAERSLYLRSTQSQKGRNVSRLAACGKALRTTVHAGVLNIRGRTVKAVVDHIIQTLPTSEGPYCPGLALDYVKSLRIILEYQPHVEHLRDVWQDILDFCLHGIGPTNEFDSQDINDESHATSGASRHVGSSIPMSRRSRPGPGPIQVLRQRSSALRKEADDLVACIHQLLRATNAPLPHANDGESDAASIARALINFVRLSDSTRLSHTDAIAAINSILSRTVVSSIDTTRRIMLDLYPCIKDVWATKFGSLKQELLAALVLTRNFVQSLASGESQEGFRSELENLLEAILTDYGRRLERDQLQMHDMRLSFRAGETTTLQLPAFGCTVASAEGCWTTVFLASLYAYIIDAQRLRAQSIQMGRESGQPKRPRMSLLYQDMIRTSSPSNSSLSTRIAAFQYLAFKAQTAPLTMHQVEELTTAMSAYILDSNPRSASWAALVCTSCAFQSSARGTKLQEVWLSILQFAIRLLSTPACSRAASYLIDVIISLRILDYASIAPYFEPILNSVELHGPATIAESTLALWNTIVDARSLENPSSATSLSERLTTWLFIKWLPSNFDDKTYITHLTSTCQPGDVVQFLRKRRGQDSQIQNCQPYATCGRIAQVWLYTAQYEALMRYLLLDSFEPFLIEPSKYLNTREDISSEKSALQTLGPMIAILDGCDAETQRALDRLGEWQAESSQSLLPSTISAIAGILVVNDSMLAAADERIGKRFEALRKKTEKLARGLADYCATPQCDPERLHAAMSTVASKLPGVNDKGWINDSSRHGDLMVTLSVYFADALEQRQRHRNSMAVDESVDDIDMDDGFESQRSGSSPMEDKENSPRDLIGVTNSMAAFRSCFMTHVQLIASSLRSAIDSDSLASDMQVLPSTFIDYLCTLSPAEFCSCRSIFAAILSADRILPSVEGESLFDHMSSFMTSYEFERHEVVLRLQVDLLKGSAPQWTGDGELGFVDAAMDAYDWFAGKALKHDICPPAVKLGVGDLLFTLLSLKGPGYKPQDTTPSIRTGIFDLLASSETSVVYYLAAKVPDFFDHITLAGHEKAFNDLHEHSMLFHENWTEGNALRVHCLAGIGARWHTLLRRCVYHIFETAGTIEAITPFATVCIKTLTRGLSISDTRSFFRFFASQLLWSWLTREEGKIEDRLNSIPYKIFGYLSLQSLLQDVKEEIYSHALMRNDATELAELATIIGMGQQDLARAAFAKAAAHCMAEDAELRRRAEDKNRAEATLRGLIGSSGSDYTKECQSHISHMLGILFMKYNFENRKGEETSERSLSDTDEQKDYAEIALEKRIGLAKASKKDCAYEISSLEILRSIRNTNSSNITLPNPQQPIFYGRLFLETVDRLARRCKIALAQLWAPPSYVYVLRLLLSSIHEALGSLHACMTIRKIRVLVALSGNTALSGYPLEMALHGLRPMLTDQQCADDTLGIVQYLYGKGTDYLRTNIKFVTGMNITMLISLRRFVGSTQESTTQESQHRSTMTKTTSFRKWLVDYWNKKISEGMANQKLLHIYLRMAQLAFEAGEKASVAPNTPESTLLLQVLDDRQSGRGLLQGATWELVLQLLCSNFEPPSSRRADFLGNEQLALKYAESVRSSSRALRSNSSYQLWAGRVLGRAVSSDGFDLALLTEKPKKSSTSSEPEHQQMTIDSESSIIKTVASLLFSGNRTHAGLAEETLRFMLLHARTKEEMLGIQESLPEAVTTGLFMQTDDFAVQVDVPETTPLHNCFADEQVADSSDWLQKLTLSLIAVGADDPIICSLSRMIAGVPHLASTLFPPILHLVLLQDLQGSKSIRKTLSQSYRSWFSSSGPALAQHTCALLNSLLYLRRQAYPSERNEMDRLRWLDVDLSEASKAAEACQMHTAALLLAELSSVAQIESKNRRSSHVSSITLPESAMLSIYRNIDDPDSFYGVPQEPSLDMVLSRLDHENDGAKSLQFRAAKLDSQLRNHTELTSADFGGLMKSLTVMNLNSLTHSLLASRTSAGIADSVLRTATKLEQWDIRAPSTDTTSSAMLYRALQTAHNATDLGLIRAGLDRGLLQTTLALSSTSPSGIRRQLNSLNMLKDIDDLLTSTTPEELRQTVASMEARNSISLDSWDIQSQRASREAIFSIICDSKVLRDNMHIDLSEARSLQVECLISSIKVWSKREDSQQALAAATHLSSLVQVCAQHGVDISRAAQIAFADVLWMQGELSTSVRLLQRLVETSPRGVKTRHGTHQAALLAKLGQRVGEARLERPQDIMSKYLAPAIKELRDKPPADVAGLVYHTFASFCDDQMRDPDAMEDFARIERIRNRRKAELDDMQADIDATRSQTEKKLKKNDRNKAMRWFELDNREYHNLLAARESFMKQSLENYMLSLQTSDDFDNDALRFYAIWLENASSESANSSVKRHLNQVASYKFARLMNQLSSRLQADSSLFQECLGELVFRICKDHPHHGMHHITAGTHDPDQDADEAVVLRHKAAKSVANRLTNDKLVKETWLGIYHSDRIYHEVAKYNNENVRQTGKELGLSQFQPTKVMQERIPRLRTPPPTLSIPLRKDKNYGNVVPVVVSFLSKMRVASGLSAPKIITSLCSDGVRFKQLFKGGHDDLRQDAIMEQVFEEVSKLLANHTATRQRRLRIRTYNVLPLSKNSGVLEFVQDTLALQEALIPLHKAYHPKDLENSRCRGKVAEVVKGTTEQRINTFRDVCNQFQPAMRHFFFERFPDPDDWFERRLAYTRSTAAISILGHIVGLGDRHLHNILLDARTGEAVHIDLGVCFEAGRVLPIPENVPFRLTRDLVDGMGHTKTEGVFKRCAEFTLDCLRTERSSIMTLLNVLRYDPLYTWTVSATKARRIQAADDDGATGLVGAAQASRALPGGGGDDDVGEAGRALAIVEKKLSKTLSKEATVSELIAQATDEKNLALLFAGWSAWV